MGGIVQWENCKLYFFPNNHTVYTTKCKIDTYNPGLRYAMDTLKHNKLIGPESFTKWID